MLNIWIVDDETNLANGLKKAFERMGFNAHVLGTIADLSRMLATEIPSLIFLDQCLPDGNGIDMLPAILKQAPRCRVIVMTAFGDSSLIVKAIKEGAYNYLDKPFPLDAAKNMVQRALESIRYQNQAERKTSAKNHRLFGHSVAIEHIRETIAKVAPHQDVTVLLTGESGTGKEVAARMIHDASGCCGDFVALNCSAIPEALLEAELFGYKKGAFTGADTDKIGLIEAADKGTLFLDEIGDMPMPLQSKLFRFLDQRTFRPLGGTSERSVHVKLICATCLDLERKVSEGSFRKDLYFRLSVVPIYLPPLKDRDRDVLCLAGIFIEDFAHRMGRKVPIFTDDVADVFLSYSWPGNVRELRNLMERILILKDPSDGFVRIADLPAEMIDIPQATSGSAVPSGISAGRTLTESIDEAERVLISNALMRCRGNKTQAAAELGISRFSLLRRMQKHGFE